MKKLFLSIFALAFIFAFNITALADEGHSHESNIKQATENFKNGTTNTDEQEISESHDDSHQDEEVKEVETSPSVDSDTEEHNDAAATHIEESHLDSNNHPSSNTEGGHEKDNHLDSENHSSDSTEGVHEEDSGGHHGPVVETPPNYKILGTYGAVNLSFVLIGVWNKWFRRKENK